jgi:hypothetical protein
LRDAPYGLEFTDHVFEDGSIRRKREGLGPFLGQGANEIFGQERRLRALTA